MANVIQRIVQLVLDKRAASKMEADAKASADKTAASFEGTMLKMAKRVGAALAAAFAARAVVNFLSDSIKAANESEKVFSSLANTVNNAGGSFKDMEAEVRALGNAFQDATIYGDEDFASGLDRLIAVTGDVEASLNNMGLVANVAAKFFNGELGPAVELVGKVMNGNTAILKRMGIEVKDAQEALDVLGQRSFGAASAAAETMSGMIDGINQAWGGFKEQIGSAMLSSGDAESGLQMLKNAIKEATKWVETNREAIGKLASGAMYLLIGATKILVTITDAGIRTIRGFGEIIVGFFAVAVGKAAIGVGLLATGLAAVLEVAAKLGKVIGFDGTADGIQSFSDRIKANAAALKEWGKTVSDVGVGSFKDGVGRFGTAMFTGTDENATGFDFGKKGKTGKNAPGGGGGEGGEEKVKAVKEEVDALTQALTRYEQAMSSAQRMSEAQGEAFDLNAAKVKALETLLQSLADANQDELAPAMRAIAAEIAGLTEVEMTEAEEAVNQFTDAMDAHQTLIYGLGDAYDAAGNEAQMLESVIQSLAMSGMAASDPIMQAYLAQLRQVKDAMKESEEQAANYGLAVENLQSVLIGAIGGGLGEVAKAKAKENLILAAEQTAHGLVSLLNPFTAAKAGGHFAAAAKFGAIAAAWSALGSAVGGGGGGGSLAGAQGASGGASQAAEAPQQEVNIYLTGPGFNALNPEVQKVVYGAQQQARERFGQNANVNIVRRK